MSSTEAAVRLIRAAAAEAADHQERFAANDTEARKIVEVMEMFLRVKGRVVYGGAAINAHMPADHKFYDPAVNLPDYDFLTPDPLQDCADLIVTFQDEGFTDVEAKFGIHEGTYKVFVNFRAAADITFMPPGLFSWITEDSVLLDGIRYASPDYLRMNMYLELSRPAGDVSRWEKVYSRLRLLNEFRPPLPAGRCVSEPLATLGSTTAAAAKATDKATKLRDQIVRSGIEAEVVFLSGASYLADPPVAPAPESVFLMVCPPDRIAELSKSLKNLKLQETLVPAVGELLPPRREYAAIPTTTGHKGSKDRELVAVVFETVACHAYTVLTSRTDDPVVMPGYRLASIDFLIQMYFAFLFANLEHLLPVRIQCVIQALIELESRRRRTTDPAHVTDVFPLDCIGHQPTLPELKKAHRERVREKRNELLAVLRQGEEGGKDAESLLNESQVSQQKQKQQKPKHFRRHTQKQHKRR